MKKIFQIKDKIIQWFRYPQSTNLQKKLIGKYTDVIDTEFTAIRLASEDSAKYITEHLRTVANFNTDYDLHEYAAEQAKIQWGMVLEFGVATGRTLNQFGRLFSEQLIWGFDSFNGLPEDWTSRMQKGFFKRNALPKVRHNCSLIIGLFDHTLPKFINDHSGPIKLLHIDSDLYSSAKTVLNLLNSQIVPGTIIVFDEYLNYPGYEYDEFKAWHQFVEHFQREYEYIGYVSKHQQVAIKVIK